MSVKQQGIVWELDLPHAEAWVLMALADHADHDGDNAHPGQQLLAWKTNYSERQVRRALDSLEKRGLIIPIEGTGHGARNKQTYRLDLSKGVKKSPLRKRTKCPQRVEQQSGQNVRSLEAGKADKMSALDGTESGHLSTQSGQNGHNKADICDTPPIRNARVEPSGNHQEPSGVCVAHAREEAFGDSPAQSATPAGNVPADSSELTLADVVAYLKAQRLDVKDPETYAEKALAEKWRNVIRKATSYKADRLAAQAAETRTLKPNAPADVTVQATPLIAALFTAQGWQLDRALPGQWEAAQQAAEDLQVYAESSTPPSPEMVACAGVFYAGRSGGWRLAYLAKDWPQIFRSLNRADKQGNAYVGANQPSQPVRAVEIEVGAYELPPDDFGGAGGVIVDYEASFDAWLAGLDEQERRALEDQERQKLFKRMPSARQWEKETIATTVAAAVRRGWIEQREAV